MHCHSDWRSERARWTRRRERRHRHTFAGGDGPEASREAELEAELAEMRKTVAALSDRVKVLERLAVDEETRLARDIDRLRTDAR